VEKYGESGLPTAEEMSNDQDLQKFVDPKKTGQKKKTPEDRRGEYDSMKCDARIWKAKPRSGGLGYDNIQCNSKKVGGGCFCKRHQAQFDADQLWLGKINEPRPEKPVGPPNSKEPRLHLWSTDADGNDIEKPRKKKTSSTKKKPVKKKSSMKKDLLDMDLDELKSILAEREKQVEEKKEEKEEEKKVEEKKEKVEEKKEEKKEEKVEEKKVEENDGNESDDTLPLPEEEKVEEKEGDEGGKGAGCFPSNDEDKDEDEEEKDIVVDGIKYQLNCEDNIVLDPEDMEIMGTWNEEEGEIEFENDELREKHQSRIE